MTKIYWPWFPTDEEIQLLMLLHFGAEVVPYDTRDLMEEDTSVVTFLKEHADDIVYLSDEALGIMFAVTANVRFRLLVGNVDNQGEAYIQSVWEYDPREPVKIRMIWPAFDIAAALEEVGVRLF